MKVGGINHIILLPAAAPQMCGAGDDARGAAASDRGQVGGRAGGWPSPPWSALAVAIVRPRAACRPATAPAAETGKARAAAARAFPALILKGKKTKKIPWSKLPVSVSWDGTKAGNINPSLRAVYRGQTLYKLVGLVDGGGPGFNVALAKKGYMIKFICNDGYKPTVSSKRIVGKKRWIIARLRNGKPMGADEGPYRFVGSFIKPFNGKLSARMIVADTADLLGSGAGAGCRHARGASLRFMSGGADMYTQMDRRGAGVGTDRGAVAAVTPCHASTTRAAAPWAAAKDDPVVLTLTANGCFVKTYTLAELQARTQAEPGSTRATRRLTHSRESSSATCSPASTGVRPRLCSPRSGYIQTIDVTVASKPQLLPRRARSRFQRPGVLTSRTSATHTRCPGPAALHVADARTSTQYMVGS